MQQRVASLPPHSEDVSHAARHWWLAHRLQAAKAQPAPAAGAAEPPVPATTPPVTAAEATVPAARAPGAAVPATPAAVTAVSAPAAAAAAKRAPPTAPGRALVNQRGRGGTEAAASAQPGAALTAAPASSAPARVAGAQGSTLVSSISSAHPVHAKDARMGGAQATAHSDCPGATASEGSAMHTEDTLNRASAQQPCTTAHGRSRALRGAHLGGPLLQMVGETMTYTRASPYHCVHVHVCVCTRAST